MTSIHVTLFLALMSITSGCASTYQAKAVNPSGFLDDHRSILVADVEGGMLQGYKNPTANLATYDKIVLKPVIVWEESVAPLTNEERKDIKALGDAFYDMLYLKLQDSHELIEQPTAGAMIIQIAITHVEQSWVAPAVITKAIWQLLVVNGAWTYISGKPLFAGEITLEFTIRDAQTNELLAAGADRRVGGLNLFHKQVFNSWGDVKNSFEFWADQSAYRLCKARGRTNCVSPSA